MSLYFKNVFPVLPIEKGQKQVHPSGVYLMPRSCPLPLPPPKKNERKKKKRNKQ